MLNFQIGAHQIFETNCTKFLEKFEKLVSLGNKLIIVKKKKRKEKKKIQEIS